MSEIAVRMLREVGTRALLRVYWGARQSCPNTYGTGRPGIHNAEEFLVDSSHLEDWSLGGEARDYPPDAWPQKCDHCPALVGAELPRIPCDCGTPLCTKQADGAPEFQVHHRRLYQVRGGDRRTTKDTFEPGDMYWAQWYPCADHAECIYGWTNCDGRHLMVVLPNGREWDTGSRASNCDLPKDNTHRCWVRHGDPDRGELVHIDKAGITCTAGAGSIQAGDYHGFLHRGILRKC